MTGRDHAARERGIIMAGTGLPPALAAQYTALRVLPDGRVCGVHRLLFHWTLHYGITADGYDGRYCYTDELYAMRDLQAWDGEGDPPGRWHKHPDTGRRRDPATGEIWHERDDAARARRAERSSSAGVGL